MAHLKAIGLSEGSFGVANLVSSDTRPELSLPSRGQVTEADVIVNARVALDPAVLQEEVERVLKRMCGDQAEFSQDAELPARATATDASLRSGK